MKVTLHSLNVTTGPILSEFIIMNSEQLARLKSNYVETIIDGMDYKTMEALVYDMLIESYELYTADEMKEEILSQYDEDMFNDILGGNV